MNNVINEFLLAGDKFMPEMHLRQPRFVYSACGPFTRHKERIKEFKRTGDTRYIYRNELDKACFQHDSTYADHKDLINRTEADKVLRDKAYDIASNPEYDGYQRGLVSMVYKFFDKKSTGSGFKKLKNTTRNSSILEIILKINAIENDVVKKTDYNTKVTSIEAQIAGLTKNTVDNLADITKLKAIDTNSFVTRTKFSADTNALDDKIDGAEKKKPDISGLATKTSLNDYLKTSTFNSKVTEVESKIKDADIIAKSAVTKANTIKSDLTAYAKKDDVATDITTIKNDYVTNASLSS